MAEDQSGDSYKVFKNLVDFINEEKKSHISGNLPDEVTRAIEEPGNIFGDYIKLEIIGRGGNGAVYRAYDKQLNRYVALKILDTTTEEEEKRFLREAETVANLKHPNIVPVYSIGKKQNRCYIAMQLVEGLTLDEASDEMNMTECLEVIVRICDALETALNHGVIHRDIKPHNILIGKNRWPYLVDFGTAKFIDSAVTYERGIIGTPQYMSPEHIEGGVLDERADIYSLGATMYRILTGSNPFDGSTPYEVISKIISTDPLPPRQLTPELPVEVESIIMKCLLKEPSLRYRDAGELKRDITNFLAGRPIEAGKPTMLYRIKRFFRGKKPIMYMILAVLAIPVLYTVYFANLHEVKTPYDPEARAKALQYLNEGKVDLKQAIELRDSRLRSDVYPLIKTSIDKLSRAISIDPYLAEAYFQRGLAYYRALELKKAISDFSKAIEYDDMLADAYFYRIFTHCYNQSYISSRDYGTEIPQDWEEKLEKDLEMLKELNAPGVRVSCAEAALNYMKMLSRSGTNNLKNPLYLLNEAKIDDPTSAEVYAIKGLIFLRNSLFIKDESEKKSYAKRAIKVFENSLKYDPNLVHTHYFMALAHRLLENMEEVIAYLDNAIELAPEYPIFLIYKAQSLASSGKQKDARLIIEQADTMRNLIRDNDLLISYHIEILSTKLMLGLKKEAQDDIKALKQLVGDASPAYLKKINSIIDKNE